MIEYRYIVINHSSDDIEDGPNECLPILGSLHRFRAAKSIDQPLESNHDSDTFCSLNANLTVAI